VDEAVAGHEGAGSREVIPAVAAGAEATQRQSAEPLRHASHTPAVLPGTWPVPGSRGPGRPGPRPVLPGQCRGGPEPLPGSRPILRAGNGAVRRDRRYGHVCEVLVKLGDVYAGLGRHEQAAGSFERVAALSREIGHAAQEADALNCLGDLQLRKGEHGQASARYSAAVLLASQAGAAAVQARTQDGLARTRLAAAHVSDHDSAEHRAAGRVRSRSGLG